VTVNQLLHPLDPEVMRADVFEGQQIFRDTDTGVIYYPEDLIILESFRGKSPIRLHMENLGITAARDFLPRSNHFHRPLPHETKLRFLREIVWFGSLTCGYGIEFNSRPPK